MNLNEYSGIVISISGGKDSQTILGVMHRMIREQNFQGTVNCVHADTGMEWNESLPQCEMLCCHYGFQLSVAKPFRPLPEHIELRCKKLQAQGRKGGFPSPSCRYCTSDTKRNPIQSVIRNMYHHKNRARVLSVTGERRQESDHRRGLPKLDPCKALTAGCRQVWNYRPILDYKIEDVWAHINATGLPRHVAYDLGNERLSCTICIPFACEGDIRNGARARPEIAEHMMRIEDETGHTFRHKKSLRSILKPEASCDLL